MTPPPPRPRALDNAPFWTAWVLVWLSSLAASLSAVLVLAWLSSRDAESALNDALETHLRAQARGVAHSLRTVPVEVVSQLSGPHSRAGIEQDLAGQRDAAGLHALALLGPDQRVLGEEGRWLPGRAEADLIARAEAGAVSTGPLYRDAAGALFLSAYAPLPGHPGWVVAVEGSAATLGAVDQLERTQLAAGLSVVALAGLLGGLLAAMVVRPLRRLDAELAHVQPGDPPDRITRQGPREVHAVAATAQRLLAGIQERDAAIADAHARELDQVTRIAAEIAHEVRNPLNAMALSTFRLAELDERERRAAVAERLRDQIRELDAIVARLVDITRPLSPQLQPVDLGEVAETVAREVGIPLETHRTTTAGLHAVGTGRPGIVAADPVMLAEVVRNLLLNARQAGARTARLELREADGAVVALFTDDGEGVDDPQPERLFQWFHTTRAQGSGLGLPLSRRMVEAQGGQLTMVAARPATFRLQLPRSAP